MKIVQNQMEEKVDIGMDIGMTRDCPLLRDALFAMWGGGIAGPLCMETSKSNSPSRKRSFTRFWLGFRV